MGAWGWGHWVVVLIIVLLVFGTKRLRGAGKDLGEAVKGFKEGMRSEDDKPAQLNDPSRDAANGSPAADATKQNDRDAR